MKKIIKILNFLDTTMQKKLLFFLKFSLLCTYLLNFSLSAAAFEDDLVVGLETDSPLVPIYLTPLINERSSFAEEYLKQLEQVIAFDLSSNGSSYLVKQTAENNALATRSARDQFDSLLDWQKKNIFFVIKGWVENKAISFVLLDVQTKSLKKIETISLTGNLNEDRLHMHRISDLIHKAFFGTNGIASTKIIYSIRTKQGQDSQKWISEIWEADYDGANARQLTQENSYCISPVYIPPKAGFVTGGYMYVSYKLGQPKIYMASFKENKAHRLTNLKGNQLMPAIARQRDQVAFISDVAGNPDLFIQPFNPEKGADGKPQQIFSARQAAQGSPTFSPDGKRIAFVSNKDGSPKIYIIKIPEAGSSLKNIQAQLISKRNRENSAPAWSPDGNKIAYCAKHGGDRQIWVYDFKTNQEKQISEGAGNKENPSWAPDSLHLVFNSSDEKQSELYLINLNQKEAIKISKGAGEKRFPNWEIR